ncbi:type I-E CRISPR-associated protein Cas7/Cse4/CasC [Nocardiopsis mangrovi]|uniref:Type I-E CRISPR-associated protein Cas7/Cse4/CasC n=1 Tax=Nocardiopsis mangrovi TaxID=1179818 RepID=A0ABV9DX82_9ACTN
MAFLDVHALQVVPPANINRDDNGSPKTAVYGGARRLRVSSQAWKRATRKALESEVAGAAVPISQRTKRLPEIVARELGERAPGLGEHAAVIAEAAVRSVFEVKTAKKNGRTATDYLLFLGVDQRTRLVDALLGAKDDLRAAAGNAKNLDKLLKDLGLRATIATGHPPAVAMFGRMIATEPTLNVDAACQVAHAISTHEVESEFDYYTAVDDADNDADETGAGMIGTIEFNAATMYRYATVDLRSLAENLGGDLGYAADMAVAFARSFLLSMPTGKRTSFANNTRPDFALVSVRRDQPVSLAAAFEHPVFGGSSGHLAESVRRLVGHHANQDAAYGTSPEFSAAVYPAWLADGERVGTGTVSPLPAAHPLPEALTEARRQVARLIGVADA